MSSAGKQLRYDKALELLGDNASRETRDAVAAWRRAEKVYERVIKRSEREEAFEIALANVRVRKRFAGSEIRNDLQLARIFESFDDSVIDEDGARMDDLEAVDSDRAYLDGRPA